MTAVEFLAENYKYLNWLTDRDEITKSEADNLRIKYFQQAKEMEKQQIMYAWDNGYDNGFVGFVAEFDSAKQYYDETFKNE